MGYRCEATTINGFVQQLAVQYVTHGYRFFVTGWVPPNKDPKTVDQKLISKYGIDISRAERSRRKKAGIAGVQYLRHGQFFVLLATHGRHRLREEEPLRDLQRVGLSYGGYWIGFRGGHASVRIDVAEYKRLLAYFEGIALRRTREAIAGELHGLRFEPYAKVSQQLRRILRRVNERRRHVGLDLVPLEAIRYRRRIYRPFEPVRSGEGAGRAPLLRREPGNAVGLITCGGSP
jgi:hypothetical protein